MTQALITQATTLTVTDVNSMVQAGTVLGKIKDYRKTLKEEEDSLTEVHLTEIAKVRAIYKPKRDKIESAIKYISDQVNQYQTLEARRAKEAEEKLAARVEKGTMKIDTAIRKMDEIVKPIDTVKTGDGTIKFRTVQKLDITDAALIPREYLVVDEAKVLEALKAGRKVTGAQLIEVQSISNYSK